MSNSGSYRKIKCPHCGRQRVLRDGVCEKCLWDADGGDYAFITRPAEYDTQGPIFVWPDENLILHGGCGAEIRPDPRPSPDGAFGTISVETNDGKTSATVSLISVGDPIVDIDSRSPMEPRGLDRKD